MERFIRLFGRDSIKCLVADREFVGNEWFQWLNDNAIQYHIRIRDNFWVEDPRTGRKIRAQHIFANLKVKAIRVLNNGRRAISLVKYGLNFIADTLLNPFRPTKINVFDFLSCT